MRSDFREVVVLRPLFCIIENFWISEKDKKRTHRKSGHEKVDARCLEDIKTIYTGIFIK